MEQHNEQSHTTADQVINRLEKDCVTPIARWHFAVKNSTFWSLWVISVLLGSCAAAATIFTFLNSGWQYRTLTHDTFFGFFLDVMPLFWLISLAALIFIGYFTVRHTARGYRFSLFLVVFSSILVSFIGGTFLYTIGIGGAIDNVRRPLPFGKPIVSLEEERWNNRDRGLVAGVVKSFDADAQLVDIELFTGETRVLSTVELEKESIELLQENNRVRVIGGYDMGSIDTFVACTVLPWEISGALPRPVPPQQMNPMIGERKNDGMRSNVCKDVRPYQRYKDVITN